MWVILQTGYRTKGGTAYGYGTSHVGPSRKLTAVCRTEGGMRKWLRRLERWAADGVGQSYHAARVPTYEGRRVNSLGGLEPASYVGPAYYADHGREAALRVMVLGVRESHATLRWEALRRRQAASLGARS
jgi:hypothetical protein